MTKTLVSANCQLLPLPGGYIATAGPGAALQLDRQAQRSASESCELWKDHGSMASVTVCSTRSCRYSRSDHMSSLFTCISVY